MNDDDINQPVHFGIVRRASGLLELSHTLELGLARIALLLSLARGKQTARMDNDE